MTDTYLKPIIGFRWWKYSYPYLSSVHWANNIVWMPCERFEAKDLSHLYINYGADFDYGIGIRSYKEKTYVKYRYHNFFLGGYVYLWGEVRVFRDGYIAQYAYPKSLSLFYCAHCCSHTHIDKGETIRMTSACPSRGQEEEIYAQIKKTIDMYSLEEAFYYFS